MFIIFWHIFFYDLWFYFSHILLHHPTFYKLHKSHHKKSYHELVWNDANEGHIVEHVVQPLGMFIPCCFSSFKYKYLFISYIFIALRAFMRHDNRCSFLIGNHHILHHKYYNCNYGEYWIDRLFGTACKYENDYIYGKIYQ